MRIERRPNVVDGRHEIFQLHVAQRRGKLPLGQGEEVRPEGVAAGDEILPQPRLRLVDAQRDRLARRQPVVFRRQALFVDAVAGLVQDSEEGGVEELFVVTGRNAAIVRPQRGAERVCRHVQPPPAEIEPDRRGRGAGEAVLHVDRKRSVKDRGVGPPSGSLPDRATNGTSSSRSPASTRPTLAVRSSGSNSSSKAS